MPQSRQAFSPAWAGLVDPETGRLPSSVPLDALWRANRVEIERGVLRFDWDSGCGYLRPPSTLLERFLGLRTDDAFLSFAQRFGPLGFSRRGDDEPIPHPPGGTSENLAVLAEAQPQALTQTARQAAFHETVMAAKAKYPDYDTVVEQSDLPINWVMSNVIQFGMPRGEQREPLKAWRRYQWEFNALLALAAALRERESPKREMFEEFQRIGVFAAAPTIPLRDIEKPFPSILDKWSTWSVRDRLVTADDVLRARTTTFVRWCGVRPALTLEAHRSGSTISLAFQDAAAHSTVGVGISLFGALTVQLLAAATGAGFAVCSACGRVFVPRRRQPAFAKRRYCRTCGREAAVRDAKAAYRAKLRELGVRRMRDLRSKDVKRRGKMAAAKQRSGK